MDTTQTADVSAGSEPVEVPEGRKSILRRLFERERVLRAQVRELADEFEQLAGAELEAIEAEEARAAQILASLKERAQALIERERSLIDREEKGKAELAESRKRQADGDARLRQAEQVLSEREQSLVAREAALAQQTAEIELRLKNVTARETLSRRLEPAPPVPQSGPSVNIDRLERLVLARRDEFPDRIVEWEAYLFELRTKAGADGALPPSLTGLVESVFSVLL